MQVEKRDLEWAAGEGLLDSDQVEPLWAGLRARSTGTELSFETAAYALGSIVVIGALSWFTTRAWQIWGDGLLTLLLLGYALSLFALGRDLRYSRGLALPGNLLFVLGVALTPLIVLGILRWSGLWDASVVPPGEALPGVQRQYMAMSGVTVLVAAGVLRRAPAPLLVAPLLVAVGAFLLDAAAWWVAPGPVEWDLRRLVAGSWGAVALGIALRLDHRTDDDWARWAYLVGLVYFWGALTAGNTESELLRFLYFLVNVGLMALAVLLRRTPFALAGALGALIYLVTISNELFRDSLLFPVVLVALGIGVIFGGVAYRRRREAIEAWAHRAVPGALRRWLPPER